MLNYVHVVALLTFPESALELAVPRGLAGVDRGVETGVETAYKNKNITKRVYANITVIRKFHLVPIYYYQEYIKGGEYIEPLIYQL